MTITEPTAGTKGGTTVRWEEQTVYGGGFEHRISIWADLVVLTAWDVDGVLQPTEA